ncbi:MAG: hypothetical protein JWP89_1402 [Schlesneria sp.]|nr:hypothetical protein [Schlesneria sp.]
MSEWVQRAIQFTQSLSRLGSEPIVSAEADEPLTKEQLAELQTSIEYKIPDSLAAFLLNESGSCRCKYSLTFRRRPTDGLVALVGEEMASQFSYSSFYGGANLCHSERLMGWNSEGVRSVFDDIDPECAELWRNSFVFMSMNCGDSLGLYTANDDIDPPVVYLSHEGTVRRPIAPTLTHFLREWETLCYIGPEHEIFETFIDSETGYLDAKVGDLAHLKTHFV